MFKPIEIKKTLTMALDKMTDSLFFSILNKSILCFEESVVVHSRKHFHAEICKDFSVFEQKQAC